MATLVQRQLHALKSVYPWISTPLVVSAPMRVFAGPSLATAVSRAGGIGFMGPGVKPADLAGALREARQILESFEPSITQLASSATHGSSQPLADFLPIGIGLQPFDADLNIAADTIREHRPIAVWLFAPRHGQEELNVWSARIREASPGTQIWIQVGSVRDAVKAAQSDQRPDVLVLQGIDAGGHGLVKGAGIVSLVPEVNDALRDTNTLKEHVIPLIAAGGIVDGRGVATALTLGAVGAALGTRFLASAEAKISRGYQEDVLRTTDGGQNTVRTSLYDQLAGRASWPTIYDGRNIVNDSVIDHEAGMDFEENKKLYTKATTLGDEGWGPKGRLTAYVGSAVGLVKDVAPAADIVNRIRGDAKSALSQAITSLQD